MINQSKNKLIDDNINMNPQVLVSKEPISKSKETTNDEISSVASDLVINSSVLQHRKSPSKPAISIEAEVKIDEEQNHTRTERLNKVDERNESVNSGGASLYVSNEITSN